MRIGVHVVLPIVGRAGAFTPLNRSREPATCAALVEVAVWHSWAIRAFICELCLPYEILNGEPFRFRLFSR